MTSVANDISLALELADAADTLTFDRFGALDLRVDTKPDLTPVTDADRSAEELLRSSLTEHRPDDSVFGEELGGTTSFTGRQWVIDPIDGTKNFVRGVPVWATLIALVTDGIPVVGVVSAPALERRWWAGDGEGAFTSFAGATRRISTSGVDDLGSASLSFSDLTTGWDALRPRFVDLTDAGGGSARTAISGRTAWWPRVPSTSPSSLTSTCGMSRRSTSWCARLVARSRTSRAARSTRPRCRRHQRIASRGGSDQA